jgi:hypothetical protein
MHHRGDSPWAFGSASHRRPPSRARSTLLVLVLLAAATSFPAVAIEPPSAGPAVPAQAAHSETDARCRTVDCAGSLFFVTTLSSDDVDAMTGVVWQPGCPVPLSALRNVHVGYLDRNGVVQAGVLTMHQAVADEVVDVFRELLALGFVIERIAPATVMGGDDDALMSANITSGFNCRRVTGGRRWSPHSEGRAIDINPLWNPYVKGNVVAPAGGREFLGGRETSGHVGLLHGTSLAVAAFERRGWTWGGRWRSLQDWQHVERELDRRPRKTAASTRSGQRSSTSP